MNNQNPVKTCPYCHAVNPMQNTVCGQCRTAFPGPNTTGNPSASGSNASTYYGQTYTPQTLDGVNVSDIRAFVGTNDEKFVRKFTKIADTHSTTGFNVLVFLLNFFFGGIIGSLWFFHRKMNKIGATIAGVGVAVWIVQLITSYYFIDVIIQFISESIYYDRLPSSTEQLIGSSWLSVVIMSFLFLFGLGFSLFIAFKADYWYYQYVKKSIRTLENKPGEVTPELLREKGGTSSVIWAIILCAYIITSFAVSYLVTDRVVGDVFEILRQNGVFDYRFQWNS